MRSKGQESVKHYSSSNLSSLEQRLLSDCSGHETICNFRTVIYIMNLRRTWEKLLLEAHAIIAIENLADVSVISSRKTGQATSIAGCLTPGILTNQIQAGFQEPRLLVVMDLRADHQPLTEMSYVSLPTTALCNRDFPLFYVYIAIPFNNKSAHSVDQMWWMLALGKFCTCMAPFPQFPTEDWSTQPPTEDWSAAPTAWATERGLSSKLPWLLIQLEDRGSTLDVRKNIIHFLSPAKLWGGRSKSHLREPAGQRVLSGHSCNELTLEI
ncbi:unnamed protein product [Nyctereutes procyonoides]|uniref:40S ribosomal protein SA n=1 Tax=Nyctereutes procyonoides TaxID=34880 RepID=A0A811Z478_NYCPR|nr:unnamed protein product [Nyctereutes procyonoides]